MTTVQRYDRGALKSAVRTEEGYMLAEGYAARPGILEYPQPDGSIRRELVAEEELHRADSLETLARKPVTLEHPEESGGERVFVSPENVEKFGVGDVSEEVAVERLNGFVKIRMAVRRKDAIDAVDAGIGELSAGYTVDLDMTPGVHPVHGRYDAIQRNRKYNHVAIVRMGRAGAGVRMRADSAINPFHPKPPSKEKNMADEVKTAITEALERRDAEDKAKQIADENAALKKKVDELTAKIDVLSKKDADDNGEDGDDTSGEKKTDAAERLAYFQARTDAMNVANHLGIKGADKLVEIVDIKREVVKAHLGEQVRSDATDAYFDAAYDLIKGQLAQSSQQQAYSGITQSFAQPPQQPNAQPRQDSMSPEDAYRANMAKAFSRK